MTLAQQASLLFNISGHLKLPEIKGPVGCRVYYDDDPGFTQFWHAAGDAGPGLRDHDFYFTIGENIGAPDCVIPTGDIAWRHTRPPVVLEEWPVVGMANGEWRTTNSELPPHPIPLLHEGGEGARLQGETTNKMFDRFTTVASWRGPTRRSSTTEELTA